MPVAKKMKKKVVKKPKKAAAPPKKVVEEPEYSSEEEEENDFIMDDNFGGDLVEDNEDVDLDDDDEAEAQDDAEEEEEDDDDDEEEDDEDDEEDDDEDDSEEEKEDAKNQIFKSYKGPKISDDNRKWLKMKKADSDDDGGSDDDDDGDGKKSKLFDDDDDDDDDEEDSDEELEVEKQARIVEAEKKQQEEEDKSAFKDTLKQQIFAVIDGEEGSTEALQALESVTPERIQKLVAILSHFKQLRDPEISREHYRQMLRHDFARYYGYNEYLMYKIMSIFTPQEAYEYLESCEAPRPITVRVNTLKTRRRDLAHALINRGCKVNPVKWNRIGLQVFESDIPIGATPEYLSGQYMLQAASSMIPVIALDAKENETVLDMCAAPGGKATHIAQCMKNTGVLFANDKVKERCTSLAANVARLGIRNTIVVNLDARKELTQRIHDFDRILLDAPCTGIGVVSRDSSIKVSKGPLDFKRMVTFQKQLLLKAIDALKKKGPNTIVYSTCSISVEENEEVIDYALKRRYVKLVPLDVADNEKFGRPGFTKWLHHRYHPSLTLTRRFYPHAHNMDGFYVAKLIRTQPGRRELSAENETEDAELEKDAAEIEVIDAQEEAQKRKRSKPANDADDDDDLSEEEDAPPKKPTKKFTKKTKNQSAPQDKGSRKKVKLSEQSTQQKSRVKKSFPSDSNNKHTPATTGIKKKKFVKKVKSK